MPLSPYLRNAIIRITLTNSAWTPPPVVYATLFSADPTSGSHELGVTRQAISWALTTTGTATNTTSAQFINLTSSLTIAYVGLMDSSTGGNLLYYNGLTTPFTTVAGDEFIIGISNIVIAVT